MGHQRSGKRDRDSWTYDYKYKVQNNKNPKICVILSVRGAKTAGKKILLAQSSGFGTI